MENKKRTFLDDDDGFLAFESLQREECAVSIVKRDLSRCIEEGSLEAGESLSVDERDIGGHSSYEEGVRGAKREMRDCEGVM